VWVDVNVFTDLLVRSASHDHDPETVCDECAASYQQALELYRADFLTGFHLSDSADYDDWQGMQREWLRRELAGILRRLAHHEAQAERFESAIAYARRWLD